MRSQRLFNIGKNLVKFAWAIEIVAVLIGFLISIIVSYSVYFEINRGNTELNFNDYAAILVAGLPFFLVAIVEATKIPIATAMMYAKHKSWKIMLFIGVLMLTMITFETMINGFERNFANLTFSIDERKDKALLIEKSINDIEEQKRAIDIIRLENVESAYAKKIALANEGFNTQVQAHNQYIQTQMKSMDSDYKPKIDAELSKLYAKETKVYESWDQERESLQRRLRTLLNKNLEGSSEDKQTLKLELDELKLEMKEKVASANFLTRPGVERKYRRLIEKKEKRLYAVSDFATGSKALEQQTQTEKQLQNHLEVLGKNYQKRVDSIRSRIDYLNTQLQNQESSNDFLHKKYRTELESFTLHASQDKAVSIQRAANQKKHLYNQHESIQAKVKVFDAKIYELKQQQTMINHDMNKLVNQNQVYRVATYISDKEDAMEVQHSLVGLVALIWFASLAFISSVTGVFLAIAGIYIQKCYDPESGEGLFT